jgi:hypothetical protein
MSNAGRHDVSVDTSYLREQAQRCVQLARDCPDVRTSHQLEAIGIELMLKAEEIDELLGDWVAMKQVI